MTDRGERPDPDARPPRWMRRLLALVLPRDDKQHLLREMDQLYRWRSTGYGRARARLWYLRHTLLFPVRLAADRARRLPGDAARGVTAFMRGVSLAARQLRRRPSYAWTVVLTLGVGVGGLATVYNAANWVLLRPVPGVRGADALVTLRLEVGDEPGGPAFPVSLPDLETLSAAAPSLQGLSGSMELDMNVAGSGLSPRRERGAVVTSDYAAVLDLSPFAGRFLGDDAEGEVVISHALWRSGFQGADGVLGAALRINGHPFTIVGIAPPGFHGAELPGGVDLWLPARALPILERSAPDVLARRDAARFHRLVGRLETGATPGQAVAQVKAGIERIRQAYSRHSFYAAYAVRAYPGIGLSPRVRDEVRRTLGLLGAAAGLLLLLAVANVANLSLASVLDRSGSTAVRMALGARRWTVVRGVLTEHAVLGLASAGAGALIAVLATTWLRELDLSTLGAPMAGMRMDVRVLLFTVTAAIAAALLSSAAPAVLATRKGGSVLARLQGQRQGSRSVAQTQTLMATAQVALSVVLLVSAGLLVQTVMNLRDVDPGFETDAVRFAVDPAAQGYDDEHIGVVLDRLERELAVGGGRAGFAAPAPLGTSYLTFPLWPPGAADDERPVIAAQVATTPGLLEVMGVQLLAGRLFDDSEAGALPAAARDDRTGSLPVVVSRSLASEILPERTALEAVGQTARAVGDRMVEIIGVVSDARILGPETSPPPTVFVPWGEGGYGAPVGWVRGPGPSEALKARVLEAVERVDPSLPVFELRTVEDQLDGLIVEQRVMGLLALAMAGIGLALAAIGLAGVLWYGVTRRRREIGVRAALGASQAALVYDITRRGAVATVLGLFIGGPGAVAAARLLKSRLFGVQALDPAVFGLGAMVVLTAAALAAWAPARQASRVPPREALNAE